MKHCCKCGAKIGAWEVPKPGEAFFPATGFGMQRLRCALLAGRHTYDEPDLAVSSWTSAWLKSIRSK
jgi:hypothetical protein